MKSGQGSQGLDDAVEAVMRLTHVITAGARNPRFTGRVSVAMGHPVTMADARVLSMLYSEKPMTTGDAADTLGVDLSRASRQFAHLQGLGLLERTADPEDGRRSVVSVSEEGLRAVDRWSIMGVNDFIAPVRDWPQDDVQRLGFYLERLTSEIADAFGYASSPRLPSGWGERSSVPEDDPAFRTFARAILRFTSWVVNSAQYAVILQAAHAPCPPQGVLALRRIARFGKPLAVVDVAQLLSVDPSRASKRIKELEAAGLVDCAVDALDKRSRRVRISRKGTALLHRIDELERKGIIEKIAGWDAEDLSALAGLFTRFESALRSSRLDDSGWAVAAAHRAQGSVGGAVPHEAQAS